MTEPEPVPADERVRRSVRRTIANVFAVLASLGILGAWSWFGVYQLEPGQAAVILRFGRFSRTIDVPGLQWHLPPPLESHEIVNVGSIEREEFGVRPGAAVDDEAHREAMMQTSDNNVVSVGFVMQYRVKDAFAARYRVADPRAAARDAAQSAVREVVGRMTIDQVLSGGRGQVEDEARDVLADTLDRYESGLEVIGIELQEVQPPDAVHEAFDDVIAAHQDRTRSVNEAQGYANEVLPRARGAASEMRESAKGYRDARIAEATGEADRFRRLYAEYEKAPEVTRQRLYFETMEEVLPRVEKVIVDPGTGGVLPHLPLSSRGQGATAVPSPGAPGGVQ